MFIRLATSARSNHCADRAPTTVQQLKLFFYLLGLREPLTFIQNVAFQYKFIRNDLLPNGPKSLNGSMPKEVSSFQSTKYGNMLVHQVDPELHSTGGGLKLCSNQFLILGV